MTGPVDPRFTSVTALDRQVAQQAKAEWYRMSLNDLQGSFANQFVPAVVPDLTMAQAAAATLGARGIASTTGKPVSIIPQGFAGYASDGRSLPGLLAQPLIEVYSNLDNGMDSSLAMDRGWASIDRMLTTQVHDAARQAESVQMVEHKVTYYIRYTEPGPCARCIILAGKHYKINIGFERHSHCFPAGVTVSGPIPRAATRRWYEGELVTLRTASGQELPVTANHPILTDRGWVPANLVKVGDQVVRSMLAEGATPLVIPDEKYVPAFIEDVWRSGSMGSPSRVPTTTEDFHGDGGHGDVDIVLPDRFLRDVANLPSREPATELVLAGRLFSSDHLHGQRSLDQSIRGVGAALGGPMGGGRHGGPFFGRLTGHADEVGLAAAAQFHPLHSSGNSGPLNAILLGETEQTRSSFILGNKSGIIGQHGMGTGSVSGISQWDAAGDPRTVEGREVYANVGRDLLDRLASQVTLDRVVQASSSYFADHVYNLESSEGWYSANGLIVSNCRCYHIAMIATYLDATDGVGRGVLVSNQSMTAGARNFVEQSPREIFDSLSTTEQDRAFTPAGAQAIRDGANIPQVVNSRRSGMSTVTDRYGTVYKTTTVGAKRGKTRLLPEACAKIAGDDRDEWIRLLKSNGYLRP